MAKKTYADVGVVKALYIYPIKSMAGIAVQEAHIGWHGLDGDRRYALKKRDSLRGFPWLTARDFPELLCYHPYFTEPTDMRNSKVRVETPTGKDYPIECPQLLDEISARCRHTAQLIHLWSGTFDAMDLSLITLSSVLWSEREAGNAIDVRRFRPNIVIEVFSEKDFPEDAWIKELLVFGDGNDAARVRANRKDLRCMVVNLDPDSGEQNPKVLKEIVKQRRNLLGIYGTAERPGKIKVGDVLRLARIQD